MRMWLGVDPPEMCRQHLLGEHKELHMLAGCIRLGKNIEGYVAKRLVRPMHLYDRHRRLVEEMSQRGYQHRSILPTLTVSQLRGASALQQPVDLTYDDMKRENRQELNRRCRACRTRMHDRQGELSL